MRHIEDIVAIEIELAALDAVPESVARELCILPVAVGESTLHVIVPVNADIPLTLDKLRFILNRSVTAATGDRAAIEAAINRHFPTPSQAAEKVILPEAMAVIDPATDFPFLDWIGRLGFSTASSVSFQLGRLSDTVDLSDGTRHYIGAGRVFYGVGWLDAHYPCNGFHKLQIRCSLPGDYITFESMRDLVPQFVPRSVCLEKFPTVSSCFARGRRPAWRIRKRVL
jgi:hypothetical protein